MQHKTKIIEKLRDLEKSLPTIQKNFSFSMEDLQDFPERCLDEISQYLTLHSEKIEDFFFTSFIEEATFKPVLIMHVIPVASIRENMQNKLFSKITSLEDSLENLLYEELSEFLFEDNTEEIRDLMKKKIENFLEKMGRKIFNTSLENAPDDSHIFNFYYEDSEGAKKHLLINFRPK